MRCREEADILGDRVVILANGGLRVSGSPVFLKSTYGRGYHLTCCPADASDAIDTEGLMQLIVQWLPGAALCEPVSGSTDVVVSFPRHCEDVLADVFDSLGAHACNHACDWIVINLCNGFSVVCLSCYTMRVRASSPQSISLTPVASAAHAAACHVLPRCTYVFTLW